MSPTDAKETEATFDGGCACGAVRYRMGSQPLFVHCCHCRSCQRESGASYALRAGSGVHRWSRGKVYPRAGKASWTLEPGYPTWLSGPARRFLCSPIALKNALTTAGSNWVPELRSISSMASASGIAPL